VGREYALTADRFREAKFHRPLFGDELKDGADATRPYGSLSVILPKWPDLVANRPFTVPTTNAHRTLKDSSSNV
jgi:hypothetical protein